MRDITARFLRSIGVPEGALDVELIAARKIAGNVLSMTIRKESPWRAEDLELFIEGLGTIDYAYEMSYVYGRRPSQGTTGSSCMRDAGRTSSSSQGRAGSASSRWKERRRRP